MAVIRGFSLCLYFFMHLCLVHGKVNATNATIHWSWDNYCGEENGTVTIVAGSGGANGQPVASCSLDGNTATLYCQVTATTSGVLSLSVTSGIVDEEEMFSGPVVHSGCSTDVDGIYKPGLGQCCFV